MKFIAIIAAALLMLSHASAAIWAEYGVQVPPARFAYVPAMPVIEIAADYYDVDDICNPAHTRRREQGCARLDDIGKMSIGVALKRRPERDIYFGMIALQPAACVIVLPRYDGLGVTHGLIAAIRRHETAHCNGWKHED